MENRDISRRQFARIAGTAAAAHIPVRGATALTAYAVAERLQSALGGDWPATATDGFKAGDPNTPVKGIATTAMATMDVLKRASRGGTDLIIAYGPTFFCRQDGPPAAGAEGINARGVRG